MHCRWLLLLPLLGCGTPDLRRDDFPAEVPRSQRHSTVWLGVPETRIEISGGEARQVRGVGLGSAVILGDDLILTALHVWSSEPAGEAAPEAVQRLRGVERGRDPNSSQASESQAESPGTMGPVPGTELMSLRNTRGRLAASGFDPEASSSTGTESGGTVNTLRDRLSRDWALARVDDPWWDPADAVVLHAPALETDWSAPEGTPLYALGFASFFDPRSEASMDINGLLGFVAPGPYTVRGSAVGAEGHGLMNYPVERPTPLGHSGGGIYIWNGTTARMELIGILSSCFEMPAPFVLRPFGLLGLEQPEIELPSLFDSEIKVVVFAPIAAVWAGLSDELRAEIEAAH
jgi:hypothetical protein